ncbi:heavy metal resistance protein [Phenylobacterium hankyongense]|uniref:Heavy metal resistance protein n=1 Tax=Phenylobacterium hankyongense TaxID=1813876 RepID=A0A328AZZ5_9CAUL|nr:periplasmic heavy metal sensor [Phenylobacterium hankyongense]RAK60197.1 heavy metal resistance protein [Phenylobacterium hankyongense]
MSPARSILLTIVLSVVAAAGGAWGGAHFVVGRMHHGTPFHQMVHEELHLTRDQDRRIDGLERDYAARRRALEAEMRAANADLAQAIRQGHAYTPAVQHAIDRSHQAMSQLQTQTILHVLAMRQVLTPDQAARFDETVGRALTEDAA